MQMEKLSNYIKENSNSLEFYIVNEGLMDWIKKFWNWLFSDAKKNADKNGGNYRISNNSIKSVVKDKISFTYDFCQLNEKNMTKLLEIMGDNFKIAKKYFENNKKLSVFSVKGKSESDEEIFAFIFCELKEIELTIKQIIFAQQIVQLNKNIENSNLTKGVVKDFNKWIKTKLKKYSLNQEVKPEVVNKEKIKLNTPEDKPTKEPSKDNETIDKENTESLYKQEKAYNDGENKDKQKFDKIDISFEEVKDIKEYCNSQNIPKKYATVLLKFNEQEEKLKNERTFRNFIVYNSTKEEKIMIGILFGEIIDKEKIKLSTCYFNPETINKYDLSKEFISALATKQVEYFDNHKDFYLLPQTLGTNLFDKQF